MDQRLGTDQLLGMDQLIEMEMDLIVGTDLLMEMISSMDLLMGIDLLLGMALLMDQLMESQLRTPSHEVHKDKPSHHIFTPFTHHNHSQHQPGCASPPKSLLPHCAHPHLPFPGCLPALSPPPRLSSELIAEPAVSAGAGDRWGLLQC